MFEIDRFSRKPIYEQFVEQVERSIISGELNENDVLPSVRLLSQELSVNPNTLQKAYTELERRGICYSVPGNGRFIAKSAAQAVKKRTSDTLLRLNLLCKECKAFGISKEAVIKVVDATYSEKEDESK